METMELYRGRLIDHIQLVVQDLAASRKFYQAAFDVLGIPLAGEGDDYYLGGRAVLAAGGKDNGKPGDRPYHPGYYACFVLDPDGNNIEAVFHGPAKKSAESVKITFAG
jgi:catechol 2,3-dioxygenase-like lactoylglutathione lyase family enzyme